MGKMVSVSTTIAYARRWQASNLNSFYIRVGRCCYSNKFWRTFSSSKSVDDHSNSTVPLMPKAEGAVDRGICLVMGAGDSIGSAVAKRFARGGYTTAVARRRKELLNATVTEIEALGKLCIPFACDARKEEDVQLMFDQVEEQHGPVEVCVFNIGANISYPIRETTAKKFFKCWEMACFSGFLTGRAAATVMVPRGRGTIIFTGATASIRGAPNFSAFSVAKSGLRSLAQSMARELGPQGIHVAHVVIDGAVDTPWVRKNFEDHIHKMPPDGIMPPDQIAEVYW
eukprot:CAMPEP_0196810154 /NCGR_PEP_ID=MMETSP1362-20130617/9990_1 /TAXON_ID=163516 /ORGANISM="Leptocylindrus danicus, Strain CCMP1856" /LENGTH=283 /DNA_ID=CAMNT_0042185041 /DNA_START=60 /DNA_END=908 /DNA_ORIENTATION=+